jgi:CubicO group peptidase (beta-lactamase class C family)
MELTTWRDGLRWPPDSSARYLRYGLGMGVNLACGEEIIGATGVWGAFAYFWPAGGAAIAGTVNLCGADRSTLLDAVVCAIRNIKR